MFRRLRHALAHLFGLRRGPVETWLEGEYLKAGHRCDVCGRLTVTSLKKVQWAVGMVECRICTHRHVAMMPALASDGFDPETGAFRDLECSNCGAMACDSIEVEAEV